MVAARFDHDEPESHLRASVLVQTALTCFDTAVSFWAERAERDLLVVLDAAFDAFAGGGALTTT